MTIREGLTHYTEVHLDRLACGRDAKRMATKYFAPIMDRDMTSLTRFEIAKRHVTLGALYPNTANKVLWLTRNMYKVLMEMGLYEGINPAIGIKKYPQHARKRVVQQGDEAMRLIRSIGDEEDIYQTFMWLLASTGVRRNEARRMEWAHLDPHTGAWMIPKTKNKHPHLVVIHPFVMTKLGRLRHIGPYVFSTRNGKPWDYNHIWRLLERVRIRAGMKNFWLHDLRRTLASWMEEAGVPVQDIQKTLNHTNVQTTQVYLGGLNPSPAITRTINRHTDLLMSYLQTAEEPPITGDIGT
jgi:integrase